MFVVVSLGGWGCEERWWGLDVLVSVKLEDVGSLGGLLDVGWWCCEVGCDFVVGGLVKGPWRGANCGFGPR